MPFTVDAVVKPYGDTSSVVARLHALQPSIPLSAYAHLVAAGRGEMRVLPHVRAYFEKEGCESLVGQGSNGIAFRVCRGASKSRNCSQCVLLKVLDSSREKVGKPSDIFIEGRIHFALSKALSGSHRVRGKDMKACPYFPALLDFVQQPPYQFLFMELVENSQSLHKSIEDLSAEQLKICVFQVLYALACFQRALPGFRHNDLHMSNILLSQRAPLKSYLLEVGSRPHYYSLRARFARSVSIIDFGLSSSTRYRNQVAEDMAYRGYGTKRCDLYDVHTLMVELREFDDLAHVSDLLRVLDAWVPRKFFTEPLSHANNGRLSTQGQAELQARGGSPLNILVTDPYFNSLHDQHASGAADVQCGYSFPTVN